MKPRLLSLLMSSLLLSPLAVQAQSAPQGEGADPPRTRDLDAVKVTGSLIPRAQVEGPSPVTTITAE